VNIKHIFKYFANNNYLQYFYFKIKALMNQRQRKKTTLKVGVDVVWKFSEGWLKFSESLTFVKKCEQPLKQFLSLRASVKRVLSNRFQKNRKVLNFRTKSFLELRFRKRILFELVSKLEMSLKKCEKYNKGLIKFRAMFTYFLSINKNFKFSIKL
jgi:hypothetical protein